MPSTRVNISANGSDLADVIASVAHQVGLSPVIDPAIRGLVTTRMQNVSVSDAMMRLHLRGQPGFALKLNCHDCGRPIPEARLRAVPGCCLCVDCQERMERGMWR